MTQTINSHNSFQYYYNTEYICSTLFRSHKPECVLFQFSKSIKLLQICNLTGSYVSQHHRRRRRDTQTNMQLTWNFINAFYINLLMLVFLLGPKMFCVCDQQQYMQREIDRDARLNVRFFFVCMFSYTCNPLCREFEEFRS